jgi:hypothetical protein
MCIDHAGSVNSRIRMEASDCWPNINALAVSDLVGHVHQ